MPTINIPNVSKTTVNGILAFLIAILTPLMSIQVPSALATPNTSHFWLWFQFGVIVVLGALRGAVGFFQGDSDTTKALIPGVAEPQQVPAHPVPYNLHDIAVK